MIGPARPPGDGASAGDGAAAGGAAGGDETVISGDHFVDPGDTTPRPTWILPVLFVDVAGQPINDTTKITGTLKVKEAHDGTLTDLATAPVALETPIGIEYRGAWSLQFPKKSFSLELRDSLGNDRDLPFLGMPAESDWVLRAGYYDRTLMRDALAFWLFAEVFGRYAARFRFVELYIDNQYWGVYLACEKIKRGQSRVNIPKVALDAAAGDITGGYFVHLEASDNGASFATATGRVWDYGYPRGEEITTAQSAYLTDFFGRFEQAMAASDFADPVVGYIKWIDQPAWVDFALFEELLRNTDGYTKSSYYQKLPDVQGGKLITSPVWDNDLAFGILNNGTHTPEGFLYEFSWNIPVPWWERLWNDPVFRQAACTRWFALRQQQLTPAAIATTLTQFKEALAVAQPRENARWQLIGQGEAMSAYVGATWDDDIAYLQQWIGLRIAWLDANLTATCP
jgi:hypothetical protein